VIERDGVKMVYVVDDNRAHATVVQTGRAVGDMLEVRGVEIGKKVVLKPVDRLADGAALRVDQK
jgi:hypothetical protein